jgi:hypothetical protein
MSPSNILYLTRFAPSPAEHFPMLFKKQRQPSNSAGIAVTMDSSG